MGIIYADDRQVAKKSSEKVYSGNPHTYVIIWNL
jgi:Holliday junction resolvase RusA-like endonuclease